MKEIINKKILKIFLNENELKFTTDNGDFLYTVYGDCCSTSVFYDFYGVKNLIGKVVKNVEEVDLTSDDLIGKDTKNYQESIQVYGFRITYEDEKFGDMSAVVSFRNYSNGYYGGSINDAVDGSNKEVTPEIFDDVIDTSKLA